MSQTWTVNLVSAFGRGQTLALALVENGFTVRILDFTDALPEAYQRGLGPFPIVKEDFVPAQKELLDAVEVLPRGVSFWLADGALELTGPMAEFYSHRADVKTWREGAKSSDFNASWLQKFLKQWASPYFSESWREVRSPIFPAEIEIGLIDHSKEPLHASFERFADLGHERVSLKSMKSVTMESRRILQIDEWKADQWVWCLSGYETSLISEEVTAKVFPHGPSEPLWGWLSVNLKIQHGPWSNGFPEYLVAVNDLYLPWTHANMAVLRKIDTDVYRAWMKVPFAQAKDAGAREEWTEALRASLDQRLPLAKWQADLKRWSLCPHSLVFDPAQKDDHGVQWKNWDWIAPETLTRLDVSARLEHEATSLQRLLDWRSDQIKKQGAKRDQTLHPS